LSLEFYKTQLNPLTFETLHRYGRSTGILVNNMETFIRTCTFKKVDQAWKTFTATNKHYQLLPVIHQQLAKELFSAVWIKEKDDKQPGRD